MRQGYSGGSNVASSCLHLFDSSCTDEEFLVYTVKYDATNKQLAIKHFIMSNHLALQFPV